MARTMVITGGGSGLGRAIARRFAAQGETVVLLGRTLDKIEKVAAELGGDASAVQCDVASPDSVRAAFKTVAERYGQIDVLINNAAIFLPFLLEDATDKQILDTILINLAGPMLCTREALPLIRDGGHIINVTSESVVVPFSHLIVYQSSKAGVEQFSQVLEREVAHRKIRVSTVRAGQMMDQDSSALAIPPEVGMAFFQKSLANGVNMRERPIAHYDSVTEAFVALVNMPPDIHMGLVTLSARHPDA